MAVTTWAILALTAASGAALAALLVSALRRDGFAFWPPPAAGSWQDYAFWGLFRAYCAGIVVLGLLDPAGLGLGPARLAVAGPLLVVAAAGTLYGYGFLGLDNTYGRAAGLVTDGIYAWSRNPQYVASVAASFAWAVAVASPLALGLSLGLTGLYLLFALNEERWLAERYGAAYRAYMARTPRFLGRRSFARAFARAGARN